MKVEKWFVSLYYPWKVVLSIYKAATHAVTRWWASAIVAIRDYFFRVFIVFCTDMSSYSFSVEGQSTSRRFFGLEYAVVNCVILMVPPVSSFSILSKPCLFIGLLVVQHLEYVSLIRRRGSPRGWYCRWKKTRQLWYGSVWSMVISRGSCRRVGVCRWVWSLCRVSLKISLMTWCWCPLARSRRKSSLHIALKSLGFGFWRLYVLMRL